MKFTISIVVDTVGGPDQMDGESFAAYVTRQRDRAEREVRHAIAENNRVRLVSNTKPRKVD